MEKELILSLTKKDFDVQTFSSGGKGGQHQNKTASGVRIVHRESGAVGESREERSQVQNKKKAFERLIASFRFKKWHTNRVREILDKKTLDQRVEEMLNVNNLKTEIRDSEGKWVDSKEL